MPYLAYCILLVFLVLAIAIALWFKTSHSNDLYADYLDKIGMQRTGLNYEAIYPAFGIEIQSNVPIELPLAVHDWTFQFDHKKAVVNCLGFWGAQWIIVIDIKKAKIDYNATTIYTCLLQREVIAPNQNLIKNELD